MSQSEYLFENAFFAAAIGMALVALDGRWIRVNPSLCELVGYSEAELLQLDFQRMTHPDDLELDLDYASRLVAGEIAHYDLEKRYFHKDGHIVWVLLTGSLVREPDGTPALFIAQVQDITEKKRVEAELDVYFYLSPDLLAIAANGYFKQVNPAWTKVLGWEAHELTQRPFIDFVHPDDVARTVVEDRCTEQGRPTANFANRYRTKDGDYRWLEWSTYVGPDGRLFSVARDVTQRRRDEERLLLQERAIASATNGIVISDVTLPGNPIIYCNPAYERITGYDAAELTGRSRDFLRRDDQQQPALDELRRAVAHGETAKVILRNYRKNGDLFLNQLTVSPVVNPEGITQHFVGVVEDVTELVKLQEEAKERTAFMEALIASFSEMGEGILVLEGAKASFVNPALSAMIGYTAEEILAASSMLDFIHPDERGAVQQQLLRRLAGQADEARYESALLHKNGSKIEVEIASSPCQTVGLYVTVIAVRDITLRKEIERQLLDAQAQLEDTVERRTAALKTALEKLGSHVNNSPLAVIEWDANFRLTNWSARAETLFGWAADEVVGKQGHEWRFAYEDDLPKINATIERLRNHVETHNSLSNRNYTKDGHLLFCDWYNSAVFDKSGKLVSILSLVQDVTSRTLAEISLRESEERFRGTFDQAAVGVAHVSLDGQWLRVNRKLCDMLGYPAEEFVQLDFRSITHADDVDADANFVDEMLRGQRRHYELEKRFIRKSGSVVWVHLTVSLQLDRHGKPSYFISVIQDINDKKETELALQRAYDDLEARVAARTRDLEHIARQMEHQALHDALTGLWNRRALIHQLEQAASRADRAQTPLALLFIDLDGFKPINDRLGHDAGDELLVQFAQRLQASVRKGDTVARLGGDEFVVLVESLKDCINDVVSIAQKILSGMSMPFVLQGRSIAISASIGGTVHLAGQADADTLLAQADAAMYRAKRSGKNSFVLFDHAESAGPTGEPAAD